jgi:hypothetical protein
MPYFTVLGDVIASRLRKNQEKLLRDLGAVLAWAGGAAAPETVYQPLQVTIGDEFQGAFHDLGTALRVALRIELRLAGSLPVRLGLGHGEIEGYDPRRGPLAQSGSAWWNARAAIERVEALEQEKRPFRRLAFASDDPLLGAAMEAWLCLRDRLLQDLDETDLAILRGLEEDRPQIEIAHELELDPAAITRRKYRRGIDALRAAYRAFDALATSTSTTRASKAPTASTTGNVNETENTSAPKRPRGKRR